MHEGKPEEIIVADCLSEMIHQMVLSLDISLSRSSLLRSIAMAVYTHPAAKQIGADYQVSTAQNENSHRKKKEEKKQMNDRSVRSTKRDARKPSTTSLPEKQIRTDDFFLSQLRGYPRGSKKRLDSRRTSSYRGSSPTSLGAGY
ncbi:hypothetical protein CEXT_509731 [Caerostris extrusa]|uniref:Uncharacterized protein n=1 Tax=Caerostris extrusa TaxID=172846 RepID=A0AAV4NG82_CAEEX|nr:hypothetical protein CEXT_509731 [Caerostris extrusa]